MVLTEAKKKAGAAVAMVACCGLSMAVALGLIAFSSTMLLAGVGVAVAVGCVVFMLAFGHGRHGHHGHHDGGEHDHADRHRVAAESVSG